MVVAIQGYLTPPLGTVVLVGVLWERANAIGAVAALAAGGSFGLVRLALATAYSSKECEWDTGSFAYIFVFMNFMHFSIVLTVITACTIVAVSLATEPPPDDTKKLVVNLGGIFTADDDDNKYASWVRPALLGSAGLAMGSAVFLWVYFA